MCCEYDKKNTAALRKKMREKGGKITAWKVYTLSPIFYGLRCLCRDNFFVNVPGEVESTRQTKTPGGDVLDYKYEPGEYSINRGIHVFLNMKQAEESANRDPSRVIVPVTCYEKDLVCAGWTNCADAVFMKVNISKRNFYKALKGDN